MRESYLRVDTVHFTVALKRVRRFRIGFRNRKRLLDGRWFFRQIDRSSRHNANKRQKYENSYHFVEINFVSCANSYQPPSPNCFHQLVTGETTSVMVAMNDFRSDVTCDCIWTFSTFLVSDWTAGVGQLVYFLCSTANVHTKVQGLTTFFWNWFGFWQFAI